MFTVRNEVAKVMFLQVSVCPQGGGVCLSAWWDTPPPRSRHPPEETPHPLEQTPPGADTPGSRHPPEQTPPRNKHPRGSRHPPGADPSGADPPPRDGHCCGRYASYWNAFLFAYDAFQLFQRGGPVEMTNNCLLNRKNRKLMEFITDSVSPV